MKDDENRPEERINTTITAVQLTIYMFAVCFGTGCTPREPVRGGSHPVVFVADGDTIKVAYGGGEEWVRFTGIDTPETPPGGVPERCGLEAAEFTEKLVAGKTVRLEFGQERRDKYGRLLAYVYVAANENQQEDGEEIFVNMALIEAGMARTLAIPPNLDHAVEFAEAAAVAKKKGIGLWGMGTCRHGGSG